MAALLRACSQDLQDLHGAGQTGDYNDDVKFHRIIKVLAYFILSLVVFCYLIFVNFFDCLFYVYVCLGFYCSRMGSDGDWERGESIYGYNALLLLLLLVPYWFQQETS